MVKGGKVVTGWNVHSHHLSMVRPKWPRVGIGEGGEGWQGGNRVGKVRSHHLSMVRPKWPRVATDDPSVVTTGSAKDMARVLFRRMV